MGRQCTWSPWSPSKQSSTRKGPLFARVQITEIVQLFWVGLLWILQKFFVKLSNYIQIQITVLALRVIIVSLWIYIPTINLPIEFFVTLVFRIWLPKVKLCQLCLIHHFKVFLLLNFCSIFIYFFHGNYFLYYIYLCKYPWEHQLCLIHLYTPYST